MSFITPRFYIEQFSTIDNKALKYTLVSILHRRFGATYHITQAILDRKQDDLFTFVLDNVGETYHTIIPDQLLALQVHVTIPGNYQYELAVINSPNQQFSIFWCFDTKRLVCKERN